METVSGTTMEATTLAGVLRTALAKPEPAAAVFTAAMMAEANAVDDAPPAATSARAAATEEQESPQVTT